MILQGSRLSRPAKFSKTIMEFGVATILKSQSRGLDLDMSAQTQLILLMKKIRHRLMWRIYEKFSKTSFSSHHLDNHPDSLGRILDLSISPKETKKETQRSRSMALEKAFLMLIPWPWDLSWDRSARCLKNPWWKPTLDVTWCEVWSFSADGALPWKPPSWNLWGRLANNIQITMGGWTQMRSPPRTSWRKWPWPCARGL